MKAYSLHPGKLYPPLHQACFHMPQQAPGDAAHIRLMTALHIRLLSCKWH